MFPTGLRDEIKDEGIVVFSNANSVQNSFCRKFESIVYEEQHPLRTDLTTRFLREMWDSDWYDDFTFTLAVDGEKMRVTPTYLSYDLQLSILLLHYAENGMKVRLKEFILYIENLGWISKNCEMTVYVDVGTVENIVIGGGKRTREAEQREGLFDLVWKDKHYGCSWLYFRHCVLERHFQNLNDFNKEMEQHYFDAYQNRQPAAACTRYTLKKFVFNEQPGLLDDETVEQNSSLIVEDQGCNFCGFYKYYDLFILLKKDSLVYLYRDVSVKNPTLCELLLCHCLEVPYEVHGVSLTGVVNGYGDENLALWADEVILFVSSQRQSGHVLNFYEDYEVCMHYRKAANVIQILGKEQGIMLFHEAYQKAIPLETLNNAE